MQNRLLMLTSQWLSGFIFAQVLSTETMWYLQLKKALKSPQVKTPHRFKDKIDQLIDMIDPELGKNDVLLLVYDPATGTTLSKNKEVAGRIDGLAFKRALFGIWLSDAPVQESLKAAMLGK